MTSMAKAIGTVRATDTNVKGHVLRASSGGGMTFTKARGLGKCMVKDLDGVIARAKAQYKLDRMAMGRQGSATQTDTWVRASAVAPRWGLPPPVALKTPNYPNLQSVTEARTISHPISNFFSLYKNPHRVAVAKDSQLLYNARREDL